MRVRDKKYTLRYMYFVVCIRAVLDKKGQLTYKRINGKRTDSRCWGWYFDVKDAIEGIKENVTDIAEDGFYEYAVIEKVPEGIIPVRTTEVQWYHYDKKTEKYSECEKPNWSEHIINWSIG